MNQPPNPDRPPSWRRPIGVAVGTWDYVHQRTIADHYDAFVADTPLCQLDLEILREYLPGCDQSDRASVLDLGCGTGRTALPLAAAGYDVIGVDLSRPMLDVLLGKSRQLGADAGRLEAVQANLVQLECFADQIADHAVCLFSTLGMIQGRKHRQTMMTHVARMIRPGGLLILHVHNRWAALREPSGMRRLTRSWIASLSDGDRDFGDSTYAYRGIEAMFMHRFSRRELRSLLGTSGWKVENIRAVTIDGTKLIEGGVFQGLRAGGFVAIARRI